jgi:glyoxylase-like metal-dependent hydrolase (beta-lactamase superfamily II)
MRISEHCYAATGLGYLPPWCVNAGIVAGANTTLVIDTGGNALAGQTVYGYAAAVRPTNKLRVINTEKHFDHIGGNCVFRENNILISGHAEIVRTQEEFVAEINEFNDCIPNHARRAANEASVFFAGTVLTLPGLPVGRDTTLDLGNITAEILLTPGHTNTNLSVWIPSDGVIYAGDCLINGYLPNLDAGGPNDWRTWLDSLDRIEALEPSVVVAGHGPVARGEDVPRIIGTVRQVLLEALDAGRSPTA